MSVNSMVGKVRDAHNRLTSLVTETPLQYHKRLSQLYAADIYLKREDQQLVRSYKLRGAYNKMLQLTTEQKQQGVVCASAGNHAQGVAYACEVLKVHGYIYMPISTPMQKVNRVKSLGGAWVTVVLVGVTFDEAATAAKVFCQKQQKTFVHPFDDLDVIAGQGTVGVEVLQQLSKKLDMVIVPVGGGGLVAGLGSYFKVQSPYTQIVGVEPVGAPSMSQALKAKKVVTLETVDTFVDGASVKTVGVQNFALAQQVIDRMQLVAEAQVCATLIDLYQCDGIVAEPAGALSVAALELLKDEIKNKTIVCVLSGGNNDLHRYPEIVARSHQGAALF